MISGLDTSVVVLLAVIGLAGGVGITAVGPGGVLPTIGLFVLTDLSPAEVAGTAIVTHIATGALATAAYRRSGQLSEPATRRTALTVAGAAVIGTPVGVLVNTVVSSRAFGLILGLFVVAAAGLVWYREHHGAVARQAHPSGGVLFPLGLVVAAASGLVGIGGPMLTVPLLVAVGLPVLGSLASAQVQSIVIASIGAVGYLTYGAVDWPLAAVVGIPELAGVLIGWKIARMLPTRVLKHALIVTLLALAPYLALSG